MTVIKILAVSMPFWIYLDYAFGPTLGQSAIISALFLLMIHGTDKLVEY